MSLLRRTFTLDESLAIIGVQGSHDVLCIDFDLTPWTNEIGADGTVTMSALRSGDEVPYVVSGIDYENGIMSWIVGAYDTQYAGFGRIQIDYNTGTSGLMRSAVFKTYTQASLGDVAQEPSNFATWYDKMLQVLTATETASEAAVEASETATAKASEASASANSAKTSEDNAKESEDNAKTSETNASSSAQSASSSASSASQSATSASQSATSASQSAQTATEAKNTAVSAKDDAETARSGAESARDQAQSIADSMVLKATDDGNGNITLTV